MAETVQSWEQVGVAQGLKPYNPNDPFASYYPVVAQRNVPPGADPASFAERCEACLRARGIIYKKNNPGDCGTPIPLDTSQLQDLSLASSAASDTTSALATFGVLSGAATAGIGTAIAIGAGVISELFTHHAQAVKTEQDTACAVAGIFNQLCSYLDANVAAGKIEPSDAVSIMSNYVSQLIGQLASIEKTCNLACYMDGWLKAHVDFAGIYYPAIFPGNVPHALSPSNPASSPISSGSPLSAPVLSVSASPILSSSGAIQVPVQFNLTWIVIAGMLLILFLIFRKG